MDVGLALPQFDFSLPGERPLRWQTVIRWAERAEAIGFGSVWLADHLFWDVAKYGGPEETFDVYDPLAGMAAIARMTAQVRLGILVASVPLRPPSVLAKALSTLDVVSGGRLVVGLGAGNYEPELDAPGVGNPLGRSLHPRRRAPGRSRAPLRANGRAHTAGRARRRFAGGMAQRKAGGHRRGGGRPTRSLAGARRAIARGQSGGRPVLDRGGRRCRSARPGL